MRHKHKFKQMDRRRTYHLRVLLPPSLYFFFECTTCEKFEVVDKDAFRRLIMGM